MELIVLVNLAFSVVGFFFIFRMWKEVKSRRDMYGENFAIPKGKERKQEYTDIDVEKLARMLKEKEPEPEPEIQPTLDEGDLQKIAAILAAQKGGA